MFPLYLTVDKATNYGTTAIGNEILSTISDCRQRCINKSCCVSIVYELQSKKCWYKDSLEGERRSEACCDSQQIENCRPGGKFV